MKVIKIGRDTTSNILLEHEMISRHHAILRIYSTGKIELISMGANGTKLNGTLVRPNVVYRVKRSDMISFAGKFQLDWALVPDPLKMVRIALLCLVICLLLGCLAVAGNKVYNYFNPQIEQDFESTKSETVLVEEVNPQTDVDGTLDVAPVDPSNDNGLTLSLDKIKAQQDSIKKQEVKEKKEYYKAIDKLFPTPKEKKKTVEKSKKTPAKQKTETETDSCNNLKNIII